MKTKIFIAVWLIIAGLLAGCQLLTEDELAALATPTSIATSAPLEVAPNTAVHLKQSGGFAGTEQEWTIFTDGRITNPDQGSRQVAPERVEQLLHSIETTGFFDLHGHYLPDDPCCDRFTYEITVITNRHSNTVITMDGAMPEALQQTVAIIQNLLQEDTDV